MLGVHVFDTHPMWREGVQKRSEGHQSIPCRRVRSDSDRLGGGQDRGAHLNAPQLGPVFRARVRCAIPRSKELRWKRRWIDQRPGILERIVQDGTYRQIPRRAAHRLDHAEEKLILRSEGGPEQRPDLGRLCQEVKPSTFCPALACLHMNQRALLL